MLASAAVEYTYELKYLRPFDHLIKATNAVRCNLNPDLLV